MVLGGGGYISPSINGVLFFCTPSLYITEYLMGRISSHTSSPMEGPTSQLSRMVNDVVTMVNVLMELYLLLQLS